MITLRFEDNIFTAANIEMITPLKEYTPNLSTHSMYRVEDYVVNAKRSQAQIIPHVNFTIHLVSGLTFSKSFYYESLSDEIKEMVIAKTKEIEDDCGFSELNEIKDKKNDIIRNQQYEEAARLRDKERKAWERLEESGYHARISKEVIEGIIIKNLRDKAEEVRMRLERIINEAKTPIEI